jgi:olefin beta-lactone synthetase
MNLAELLDIRTAEAPDTVAVVRSHAGVDAATTYGELSAGAAAVAATLLDAGLGMGDPVLVLLPMSAELYTVLLGLWRIGAVAVFADPSAGRARMEHSCAAVPLKAFVGTRTAQLLRLSSAALRSVPRAFVVGGSFPGAVRLAAGSGKPKRAVAELDPGSAALVTFTSGSTGEPKAIARSHAFLLAQHEVLARHLALRPGQVDLTTLPVFALANLASGVTSVIPDADLRRVGAIDAAPVVDQMARTGVTRAGASPAFMARLVAHCEREGLTLDALRHLHTGGAPVFPRLLDGLAAIAPHASVTSVYGSTEAEPIALHDAAATTADDRRAMSSGSGLLAGTPVAEVRLRLIASRPGEPAGPFDDAGFAAACVPAGHAGEIVVTGRHVVGGYLGGRGDREAKIDVGGVRWHRTGDAGRLDAEGRLWLLGRAGARIDDAGGKLYPFGVECAAMEDPGVARCALVAWEGRRVLVAEPARGGLDAEALRRRLDWASLDRVHVTRELPVDRRHNAKTDYPALERLLRHELGGS